MEESYNPRLEDMPGSIEASNFYRMRPREGSVVRVICSRCLRLFNGKREFGELATVAGDALEIRAAATCSAANPSLPLTAHIAKAGR